MSEGDRNIDWTLIGACLICWVIYAIPLTVGILLEMALPRHWVAG